MEWNDWLLALHVLSAFALAGAMVFFWFFAITLRRAELPEDVARVGQPIAVGGIVVGIGSLGTIVFGVWLAIALDGIQVWDGGVIAAIVLWAIGVETGRRSGDEFKATITKASELVAAGQTGPNAELRARVQESRPFLLHTIASVAVVLVLIDMIWKPGS